MMTTTDTATKVCRTCQIEKPLTDFHRRSHGSPDGRMASCRSCRGTKQPRHQRARKERRVDLADVIASILAEVPCFGCRKMENTRLIHGCGPWIPSDLTEVIAKLATAQVWCDRCDHTAPRTRAKLMIRNWGARSEEILKAAISGAGVETRIKENPTLAFRFSDQGETWSAGKKSAQRRHLAAEQWEMYADPEQVTELNHSLHVTTYKRRKSVKEWEVREADHADAFEAINGYRRGGGDRWSDDAQ